MKILTKHFTVSLLLLTFLLFHECTNSKNDKLTFPYSQWTVGEGTSNISWHFQEGFEYNNSFIKAPAEGEWDVWYGKITAYREAVLEKAGKETPYLYCEFPAKETKIHFDKFAYQLNLKPGEEIEISGLSNSPETDFVLYFDFDLKTKGEELSYVVREKYYKSDSLQVSTSNEWVTFTKSLKVPKFSVDSFSIVPIITIKPIENETEILLQEIQLIVGYTESRKKVLSSIEKYLARQAENSVMEIPDELAWTHQNFVMGFAFIWDAEFWNSEKGEYMVDSYCETMNKEFGGLQSVVLWHSYPNIGIDEKNQFDMLRAMPGGIAGLKQMVDDFHRNGVKVFITYNPWDLDTRRPESHDFVELAKVINETDSDGIYLDTWKCSKGIISVFETENSMRDEVAKFGKSVAFTTEILPDLKDLFGDDALTSSWGQEIHPFNYTDLSHHKWLMPQHKQYYIQRMTKVRKPVMAHAWINGQGVQVWENIFGTMNLWSADHRKFLRKMNAIWKTYGSLYITDNWQPFIQLSNKDIVASQWQKDGYTITNLVDTTQSFSKIKIEVKPDDSIKYFDIWKGIELQKITENGKAFVELSINDFGCLLETKEFDNKLAVLLKIQEKETNTQLPAYDPYETELSLKETIKFNYNKLIKSGFSPDLIEVEGVENTFNCSHILREGRCYPNMDAKYNHDLTVSFKDGSQQVIHTHHEVLSPFSIMPRVVTNAQFEEFMKATDYSPRFNENFLKHWEGRTCPENIKDEPVVYVSLQDARAFAEWAGMELPTEWEWQLAAEVYKDKFRFNEVFEFNESERFDGFNRSVSLRGGCSRWITPSSWWYLPSAPYGEKPGGPQKYDSHVKYFLMYPGLDRASTIGFRCILK